LCYASGCRRRIDKRVSLACNPSPAREKRQCPLHQSPPALSRTRSPFRGCDGDNATFTARRAETIAKRLFPLQVSTGSLVARFLQQNL